MAIAFDTIANDPASSSAYVTSGSNRLLLYGIQGGTATSVTYGGIALTKLIDILDSSGAGFQLWYLVNPASGSNTFVHDSSGARHFLVSYSGVLQSGFPDSSATNNSTTNPKTLATTTVLDNSWIAAFAMDSQGSVAQSTGATRGTIGGFAIWFDSNAPKTPAGSYNSTASWTAGAGSNCAMLVVSFAPALAAATTPSGSFNFI